VKNAATRHDGKQRNLGEEHTLVKNASGADDDMHPTDFVEKVKALRKSEYDIVERAGLLGLPLVLGETKSKSFNLAFHCAIAELAVRFEKNGSGLDKDLLGQFDKKTVRKHFFNKHSLLPSVLASDAEAFTEGTREKIICMAYPWFNARLYSDLARITESINAEDNNNYTGKYRYFRSYPKDSSTFELSDGFLDVRFDPIRRMLVFGQIARMHDDFDQKTFDDENNTLFEHRGFVLVGVAGNISLISFRQGVIRFSVLRWRPGDWSGIVLSTTRQNARPFAAKALIVKEGRSELYAKNMGLVRSKFLDPDDLDCKSIKSQMEAMNKNTIFVENGWMWGD
jgi:hypothetical protein